MKVVAMIALITVPDNTPDFIIQPSIEEALNEMLMMDGFEGSEIKHFDAKIVEDE